jgi:signal peptidase II
MRGVRVCGDGDSDVVVAQDEGTAIGLRSRWLPFAIAAGVLVLDRVTKIYIRDHFSYFDIRGVIPNWFRIIHTENPGAAFGMLADGNPVVRGFVLVGISLVVLFFVVSTLLKRSAGFAGLASRIGLGFILGGAAGNLYDRIFRGTVTDFIEVYHGAWSFPAFNVADSAITIGSVFLLIDLLWPAQKRVGTHAS